MGESIVKGVRSAYEVHLDDVEKVFVSPNVYDGGKRGSIWVMFRGQGQEFCQTLVRYYGPVEKLRMIAEAWAPVGVQIAEEVEKELSSRLRESDARVHELELQLEEAEKRVAELEAKLKAREGETNGGA